jgi:son of sevenless-like protein
MATSSLSRRSQPAAGPSTYASPVQAPASPPPRPTHVQAIHDFDHTLLASANANTSAVNLYLSFKGGEIIKVHNREGNGWWDGEISRVGEDAKKGPRRGWFPSNYVREMGFDGVSVFHMR